MKLASSAAAFRDAKPWLGQHGEEVDLFRVSMEAIECCDDSSRSWNGQAFDPIRRDGVLSSC